MIYCCLLCALVLLIASKFRRVPSQFRNSSRYQRLFLVRSGRKHPLQNISASLMEFLKRIIHILSGKKKNHKALMKMNKTEYWQRWKFMLSAEDIFQRHILNMLQPSKLCVNFPLRQKIKWHQIIMPLVLETKVNLL